MWQARIIKSIVILGLLLFCWLALYGGTFPLTRLTPLWGRMGYFDWPIFIDAATHFLASGILYYPELELYAPNAAIYKFPPLFASILVVLLRVGMEAEMLRMVIGSLQLLMYFVSLGLCLWLSKIRLSFLVGTSLFLFVATFEPFINNFIGLQLEAFVLFLLCLMLWCLVRQKPFWAGFLLGFAIALKLYPALLLLIALYSGHRLKFLQGVLAALVASLVFTTLMIGIEQSWLYFSRIAPALATEALDTQLRNISINNLWVQLGAPVHYALYAGAIVLAATTVVLLAGCRAAPHPVLVMAALALLVSALVLAVKNSWGNYQLLLALPVMLLLAEAVKDKKVDYLAVALLYIACGLIFFSPPHRLYFVCEILFGLQEIPVVPLFVAIRAGASLIIFLLCLRFFCRVSRAQKTG